MAANGERSEFDELRKIQERKRKEIGTATPEPTTIKIPADRFRPKPITAEERERREKLKAEREAEKLRREKLAALARLKADCGSRLASASLENFEKYDPAQSKTLDVLRRYVEKIGERIEAGDSLFFIGPPGTGKDHLAVAVARAAIIETGCSARWLDCSSFRMALRDGMKRSESESRSFAPLLQAGILILSDPVAPGDGLTAYQADALFRLVDGRYRNQRPTFITANFQDEAEASSALGSQVVDRLSHGGFRVKCFWESFRKRKG